MNNNNFDLDDIDDYIGNKFNEMKDGVDHVIKSSKGELVELRDNLQKRVDKISEEIDRKDDN